VLQTKKQMFSQEEVRSTKISEVESYVVNGTKSSSGQQRERGEQRDNGQLWIGQSFYY